MIVAPTACHQGSKPFRIHFVDDKRMVTVGTQKSATREIALWNLVSFFLFISLKDIAIHKSLLTAGSIHIRAHGLLLIVYPASSGTP